MALIPFFSLAEEAIQSTPVTASPPSTEPWKGSVPIFMNQAGGLLGLGIYDDSVGFAMLGHYGVNILEHGFIDDIADQVFLEGEFGPVFVKSSTAWFFSFHMRWDFHKDSRSTFYALGGLGGSITGSDLGNSFRLFPRLGIGAFLPLSEFVALRAEVSHEIIVAGASVAF